MLDATGRELMSWLLPVNVATAVLLACALLLDRALARRARASLRIALYAPVALRVLVPLSWAIPAPQVPSLALHIPTEALSARVAQASPAGIPWDVAVAVVYVAVVLGLGLRALARRRMLERAIGAARPLRDVERGVEAPCPVLCHDDLGPMVVGLLPPRIVLPQSLVDGASRSALACIAKHEAAHVRRGDPWLVAGMELLLVVAWPVLPLWVAAARVRHLVELACDEAALEHADADERRRYGHLLLDVAEHRPLVFSGGVLHFGSTLRARVEAIALQRRWPRTVQLALVGAAVAGFAACSSTAPQATGSTAAASSVDEYGYRYEDDPFRANPVMDHVPAERDPHGRLAPEVIQNVVRASFGRFRTCYEQGLKRDPKLEGVVTVKYVILPTGAVRDVADDGSTLPDLEAIQCVVRGFGDLTYPAPEGGYVTVVYPVQFRPGD